MRDDECPQEAPSKGILDVAASGATDAGGDLTADQFNAAQDAMAREHSLEPGTLHRVAEVSTPESGNDQEPPPATLSQPEYAVLRTFIGQVCCTLGSIQVEHFDRLIATAERALSAGPVLDPTLARDAGPALVEELRTFRAVRDLRRVIEDQRTEEAAAGR